MGDKKNTTFITAEGLIADYKLISYFQLRNEDIKVVVFSEEKFHDNLYYGKILGEEDNIRVIKPSNAEILKIEEILDEPKAIKYMRLSDNELDKLYVINFITKGISDEQYNLLMESDLFKKKKNLNPKVDTLKEKKMELTTELDELRREQVAAKWKEVKNESRTITDDSLLEEVEQELKKLEKNDFIEECSNRYNKTIKANFITLIVVFSFFLLTSFGGAVLKFFKSDINASVFLDLLKDYGRYAMILLIIQSLTSIFFKKYRLIGRIFTLFGVVYYILRSLQLLLRSSINFGFILIAIIVVINVSFGMHTYLKLRTKEDMFL